MPETQERLRALVVVAAVLLLGVVIVGMVYGTVPGESETLSTGVTVDYEDDSVLDPGEDVRSWDDEVTVNDSEGTTLTEGVDYNWHDSNGTIEWVNTTETTGGEEVSVEAGYTAPLDNAQSVMATLGPSFELGSIIPIVLVAVVVLGLLGRFSSAGGSGGSGGSLRR